MNEIIRQLLEFAERRLQTCEDWEMRYWAGYIDGVKRVQKEVDNGTDTQE